MVKLLTGQNHKLFRSAIFISLSLIVTQANVGLALPPPEDIPEEVLRTEIITEARSPVDGEPLTVEEYAQLKAILAESPFPPQLDTRIRRLVFLLRLRKMFKTFIPL